MNNQLILNSVVDLSSKFISNLDILDYLNGNSNNDEINFNSEDNDIGNDIRKILEAFPEGKIV